MVLPAASRARAASVCVPLLAVALFQEVEYGAVVTSAPSDAPSSRNWTPATPTLSLALAETVTVPDTVAPLAGAVMETVGGVISGAALEVVTVMAVLVVWLPTPSRARADSVWVPLAVPALFQVME